MRARTDLPARQLGPIELQCGGGGNWIRVDQDGHIKRDDARADSRQADGGDVDREGGLREGPIGSRLRSMAVNALMTTDGY